LPLMPKTSNRPSDSMRPFLVTLPTFKSVMVRCGSTHKPAFP